MKILKRILLVLLALVALILIIGLFVNKEYTVEREITINKSNQEVFDYLKLLKNQDNFSKWAKMDPGMKKSYRGTDGTVGFVSAWESDRDSVGKGEQEIKAIEEGRKIDYELRFKEPFESTASASITTEAVGENQTKVKWSFKGSMPYPMNIMLLFMNMDKMLGNDLMTGLTNLKGIMEQMPASTPPPADPAMESKDTTNTAATAKP